MPRSPRRSPVPAGSDQDVAAAREIIGYLNFSNGQPDVAFQRALNALAYLLAEDGQELDLALALISRALAQVPDDPSYLDTLGWVQYRRGRLPGSRIA